MIPIMIWDLQPFALALMLGAVLTATLALFAWQRRSAPGSIPFSLLMLAGACWMIFAALEFSSFDHDLKILFSKLSYIGIVVLGPLWLLFAVQYTGCVIEKAKKYVPYLFVIPAVVLALVFTNEWHGLIWTNVHALPGTNGGILIYSHGVGVWINAAYSYLAILAGSILLVQAIIRFPKLYRRQFWALLVGVSLPFVGNIAYVSGLNPIPELDFTPFFIPISGILFAWCMFRYQMLDILPVARSALIESMSDGVLVIDSGNRLVDINPAACKLFKFEQGTIVGQSLEKIFSDREDLTERFQTRDQIQTEIHIGELNGRDLDLRISPLLDNQLSEAGRLVVLRDITDQKGMERDLRESEEWFRTIFDRSPIGILTADANGLITQINNAYLEIIGAANQRQDIVGQRNLLTLESLKTAEIDVYFRQLYTDGEPFNTETPLLLSNGKLTSIKYGAVPVKDGNGRVTGCIVNAEDISVRKEVEVAEQKARSISEALQAAGLAINSTLDFDLILNLILEEIGHVITYDSASVALIQGNEMVLVGFRGLEDMTGSSEGAFGYRWKLEGPDVKVVEERRPIIFGDIRGDYAQYFPPPYDYIRSLLMIPLFSREEIIGILNLDSASLDHFSVEDERVAGAFGAQVSVALENSHLYSDAQRRIMEQSILNEVIQSVSSKLEIKELLELVDKQMNRYMDIHFLLIASYEEETDMWQVVYLNDPQSTESDFLNRQYQSSEGVSSYVIGTRKPLLLNTSGEIKAFIHETGRKLLFYLPKSMMITPLIVSDKVVGFMSTQGYEKDNYFPEDDFSLFCLIGTQIAVAFENARLFEKVKQLAITDTLTGLFTRRHFFNLAETEVQRVGRYQKDLSLIMIDFDHFKSVNDTFGHLVGDQVLLTFGRRLREAMRPMDIAGRYGGEEFVVLLPETSIHNAILVADRLRKIVSNTEIVTHQGNVKVTISLGVAMINSQHATLESLLDHADQALYLAKQEGKNRVKVYSP